MEKKTLSVQPDGELLNDNDIGVDYLNYSVYSEALASQLEHATTPITVGIFAPWGSGKTFMLNQVKGQLLKSALQEEHDIKLKKFESSKRLGIETQHVEVATQVDGKVDENTPLEKSELKNIVTSHKEVVRRRKCAFITWTIAVVIIMLSLAGSCFAVFHKPTRVWLLNEYLDGNHNITSDTNLSDILTNFDFTDDDQSKITSNFRTWAMIVLIVTLSCVIMVFCCCITNTNSKFWEHARSNFCLIMYVAFTRFPREPSSVAGVIFDEDVALELDDSNNQESNKDIMPVKYIMVNFRAWEYAGSDSLWAGIVTTLSDSVEEHLGTVTTRLFRLLHVEETSKRGNIKVSSNPKKDDPFMLYIKVNSKQRYDDVRGILTQYGVVTHFTELSITSESFKWWSVRYSRPSEAHFAHEALTAVGLTVQRHRPQENANFVHFRDDVIHRDVTDATEQDEDIEMNDQVHRNDCSKFCKHFRQNPKTICCQCPYLYMWILFVVSCILLPIIFCIFANKLELGLIEAPRLIPAEVQILSWIPATIGILVIVVRFSWAMCNSQTTRIQRSLEGAHGNMATKLGFMNEVKEEVMIISKMMRCLRFTHKVNYKIVISIDDLDRCPYDKVKSVLEAVNILLSDRSSSFICLVAIDSRIAVKCIEQDMGEALQKANVTGYEYLKKIINLPVCLPVITTGRKCKFMRGMVVEADETAMRVHRSSTVEQKYIHLGRGEDKIETNPDCVDSNPNDEAVGDSVDRSSKRTSHKQCLLYCRRCFQNDDVIIRCLSSNPRNMKRIFNVLSFTAKIIRCKEKEIQRQRLLEEFSVDEIGKHQGGGAIYGRSEIHAKTLVRWLVLVEQWPYRTSFLLVKIKDQEPSKTLYEVYKDHVVNELTQEHSEMLHMDLESRGFELLLSDSNYLTVEKARQLISFTTNLDFSIQFEIDKKLSAAE